MSEKREKKRRYNLRLEYIKKFSDWLAGEPPMWMLYSWHKWKKSRPIWDKRNGSISDVWWDELW